MAVVALALLLLTGATASEIGTLQRYDDSNGRCEALTLPMCKTMGVYNVTRMPNFFGHETQEEAAMEVNQFWPLIKINCSTQMHLFLCSLYAPICVRDYEKRMPPCRSVCQAAFNGCEPIMKQYQFVWPEKFNCANFPVEGDKNELCVKPPESARRPSRPPQPSAPPSSGLFPASGPSFDSYDLADSDCECTCRPPLRALPPSQSHISIAGVPSCTTPCNSVYFSLAQRNFTTFWLWLWAVLCCASTLATLATFAIDPSRFQYPERPIVFLTMCYFFVSVGYLVRLGFGHAETACEANTDTVRAGTINSLPCTLVFVLTYFFSIASGVWWVVLTVTWFLAAGMKWSCEAIARHACYFHGFAWAVPAIATAAALATSSVDGDPVSGLCSVGNTNITALRWFIVTPSLACLAIGSLFLLAGFVSLFRIRRVVKAQNVDSIDKLEQLMVRIGVFSVLYTVPASAAAACALYELHYRPVWEASLACSDGCLSGPRFRPDHSIFMLKYVTALLVGVASSVWIWSRKTAAAWQRCAIRCCCCTDPDYQPAELVVGQFRSATDVSYGYNKHYPLSHV